VDQREPRVVRTAIAHRVDINEQYGLTPVDIAITPRMVVLHWTAIDDLEGSFRAFDRETLAGRPELPGGGGANGVDNLADAQVAANIRLVR
jgi:hypothetical protein